MTSERHNRRVNIPLLSAVTLAAVIAGVLSHLYLKSSWWEVAAFVTSVVGVYLCAVEQIVAWPASIFASILWGYVVFSQNLYADTALQGVYVVLSIHGWISWRSGGKASTPLKITRTKPRFWIVFGVLAAIGIIGLHPFDVMLHGAQTWLDTSLLVLSIGAQIQQNRKLIENWISWFVIDAAYIALYLNQKSYLFALMSGLLVMLAVWGFIDWYVAINPKKPFFVVITGVESSGKSTLAQLLATHLRSEWVPEYGREYTEIKYAKGDHEWSDADFVAIAKEQVRQEVEASAKTKGVLIGDTDAFATGVWAERYLGHRIDEVEEIARHSVPDLYILALPDFPFVPDDIRDGEHIREWMHELFVERLKERGVRVVEVGGPPQDRLATVLLLIKELKRKNRRPTALPTTTV